ncbi:MAG: hypothetical protein ACE5E8_00820 [Acidimicrobiia bacterium]
MLALVAGACTTTDLSGGNRPPTTPPPPTVANTLVTSTTVSPGPTTTTTGARFQPLIPARGLRYDWVLHVAGTAGGAMYGDGARPLFDASIPLMGSKTVADDGAGGLVFIDASLDLWWVRAGLLYPVLVKANFGASLIGVAPGTHTLVYMVEDNPAYLDLDSGELAEPPPPEVDPTATGRAETPLVRRAQGRVAFIEGPEPAVDAEGQPAFDVLDLVVTDEAGDEILRAAVTTEAEPLAWINDFDGRRVLFSRSPFEPALAPATVFLVDLECPGCTHVGFADAPSADLVGTLPIESGEASVPDLDPCPGIDLAAELPADEELPSPVTAMRSRLFTAAAGCDYGSLEQITGSEFTPVVGPAATRSGWRGAATAHPTLAADVVESLTSPAHQLAEGGFRWPGWVGRSWAELSEDVQAAVQADYGSLCSEDETYDSFEACFNSGKPALNILVVEVAADGRVQLVGIAGG